MRTTISNKLILSLIVKFQEVYYQFISGKKENLKKIKHDNNL